MRRKRLLLAATIIGYWTRRFVSLSQLAMTEKTFNKWLFHRPQFIMSHIARSFLLKMTHFISGWWLMAKKEKKSYLPCMYPKFQLKQPRYPQEFHAYVLCPLGDHIHQYIVSSEIARWVLKWNEWMREEKIN